MNKRQADCRPFGNRLSALQARTTSGFAAFTPIGQMVRGTMVIIGTECRMLNWKRVFTVPSGHRRPL